MVNTTSAQSLTLLQNFITNFVSLLDGEAAIPSMDRQLTSDNIDEINVIIADMLAQFDVIVNEVDA